MPKRVCPCLGCAAHDGSCPKLTNGGRCPRCTRAADKARGTRQQRGYTSEHDQLRRTWARRIARSPVPCARNCGQLIHPGDDWHLDHRDDRRGYLGPSCATCNLSAAGRAAHQ